MKYLYLFFILLLFSCWETNGDRLMINPDRAKKKPLTGKTIIITGRISNFGADSIYLYQQPYWDEFLVTVPLVNDSFRMEVDSSLLLNQFDSYGMKYKKINFKRKGFDFTNHILTTPKQKYLSNFFLIDTSSIIVNGDAKKDSGLYITAGKNNESMFRCQWLQFGYLSNDSAKRKNEMEKYLSIIKEYPSSQYLLSKIDENKSVIKREELAQLLQGFDQRAIRSNIGKKMLAYLTKKTDNQQITDMVLEDDNGKASSVLNTTGKVNMLVIWASWCGPCRREIPGLKKLYDKYKDRGLTITSVSTDENRASWKAALFVESMPWKQLIVPKDKIELFNLTYEVGSIPYVLFLDDKGKVITRSIGFDENTSGEYESIIAKYIK
ncbi:MAG: TlpA family protein disulfide reductase [Chitinophagaceae bacterium]|jgi:thiol-disulfide isomerase/thioredoxin|nr:TlpA family protein disulfide reductase [Chitinophagaceae bacterium]